MSQPNELTVHIALSTLPHNQYEEFVHDIETNFYEKYAKDTQQIFKDCDSKESYDKDLLYRPLKYFILGHYDIAFISIIDRYKFAQRLFAPVDNDASNPATFQIITGITLLPCGGDLTGLISRLHKNDQEKKFVGIINLKVNNGLLIGNGNFYIDKVVLLVKNIMESRFKESDFIILHAFSWFELSLLFFYDDPQMLADVIKELRIQKVGNIENVDDCIASSFYYSELNTQHEPPIAHKDCVERIKHTHVFSDSYTYMGINWNLLTSKSPEALKALEKIELPTEIEWIVSPGHNANLINLIKNTDLRDVFDMNNIKALLGKSDFLMPEQNNSILNNYKLFRNLHQKNNKFHPYVKKVKTKVLFLHTTGDSDFEPEVIHSISGDKLKKTLDSLVLQNSEIKDIDTALKELKVSRLLRIKVNKVLFNYNTGIQDNILYNFFLDFVIFIKFLRSYILNENQKLKAFAGEGQHKYHNDKPGVSTFESDLTKLIEGFEESFSVRMLNSYQFEDINDFDLDFNASVQQLLTTYNTLALEIGNIYYHPYTQGHVVQLNFKNIIANYYFINYNCYHLTTPEFIFFTITKEILNHYHFNLGDKKNQEENKELKRKIHEAISSKHAFLKDAISRGMLDLDYLFLDAIRLCLNCNLDFDLFSFCFWNYNCQNSSLYNVYGCMEEKHFQTELSRLILLSKLFGISSDKLICPVSELESVWEDYFYITDKELTECFKDPEINNLFRAFFKNVLSVVKTALGVLGQEDIALYTKWYEKFDNTSLIDKVSRYKKDKDQATASITNLIELGHAEGEYRILPAYSSFQDTTNIFFENYVDHIRLGKPLYYDESYYNPYMFISSLMYSYLRIIYEENNKKVYFLRRDRGTGSPLHCFIDADRDHEHHQTHFMYYVDQTGGTFFINRQQMNKYFNIRNGVLQSVWHFAAFRKNAMIMQTAKNFRK